MIAGRMDFRMLRLVAAPSKLETHRAKHRA